MKINSVRELERYREKLSASERYGGRKLLVCCGPGCLARGSKKVAESIRGELSKKKGSPPLPVIETGCHGLCECGPLVILEPEGTFYTRVKPDDASEIIQKTVGKGEILDRLLYKHPNNGSRCRTYGEIPFYSRQERIALRFVGRIDPERIDDYIQAGGYNALAKVLESMKAVSNCALGSLYTQLIATGYVEDELLVVAINITEYTEVPLYNLFLPYITA